MKPQTPELMQILHDRLTMAHYALGEKLRPALLSEEFGVSSNTIREIMLRLATKGLLDYEDQRGFRVTAASDTRLRELTEFRILLEQEGAARSIERGGIEWEAQMTAAHHKLSHIEAQIRRAPDFGPLLPPWNRAELEFHLSLMAAAQLPVLVETFRTVYARFRQQIVTPEKRYGHHDSNIAEHQRILEAALNRDAAACSRAIHNHLSRNLIPSAGAPAAA